MSLFDPKVSQKWVTQEEEFTLFTRKQAALVFYDIETGGLDPLRQEILQICMKFQDKMFSTYITPAKAIDLTATKINHLSRIGKKDFRMGIKVPTLSKKEAMLKMLEFLKATGQKCLLVAHNDKFDAPRVLHLLQDLGLDEEFEKLTYGFSDSLKLFKDTFPKLECHKLEFLATNKLSESCEDAHDATFDVRILEKLAAEFLNVEDFFRVAKPFDYVVNLLQKKDIKKTLDPLVGDISDGMLNRLAISGLSYHLILETFHTEGQEKVAELLRQEEEGKATIIKSKSIVDAILEHFINLFKMLEREDEISSQEIVDKGACMF